MPNDDASSVRTRPSLLDRLKAGDDTASWQDFYRIYGKLVRDFALAAGLTETEADEAVQETVIAMARHLPGYQYDPEVCRFKTWLLNQASWRIKDHLKKRRRSERFSGPPATPPKDDSTRTEMIHRVPDPASADLDALFEKEWRRSLFTLALDRVKERFSLKQLQIFDLLAFKEWPAAEVAKSLGVSIPSVYVTRHRIAHSIAKEIKRLERGVGAAGPFSA